MDYNYEGRKRDPFESSLLKKYFGDKDSVHTPMLGICRGMQMLGVSQGIPLYMDIKKELDIRNRRWTIDRIHVRKPNSTIQSSVDKARFWGVEYHHQGLRLDYFTKHKDRWPNVEVTAVSNGGKIAEALEFSDRPVMGVQFHPEWTFGRVRRGVFSWLLTKACHKEEQWSKRTKQTSRHSLKTDYQGRLNEVFDSQSHFKSFIAAQAFAGIEHAPSPFQTEHGRAIFVDFQKATYNLLYDKENTVAYADTEIIFTANDTGLPIFDSVNAPYGVMLDGKAS